jgi:DNA-binding MarR family transcriptional regulator
MRCLCATVRRAGRLLTRRYEDALRPAGINVSQYELMMTVRAAQPIGQAALATLLDIDQTTLSRNIKVLLRERWIEESKADRDARRRTYTVSKLGSAVLTDATSYWQRVHDEMGRLLPMADLWPVLDRVTNAARQPSSAA